MEEEDALWTTHLDIKTGKEYYHNVANGVTSWNQPDNKWHEGRDTVTGRIYYFNLALQTSMWAKPADYNEEDDQIEEPPGELAEYEYTLADGISDGKWIPAICGDTGKQYWYCSTDPRPYWTKPRSAKHPHKDPVSTKDELLNESTRQLRYAVNRLKEVVLLQRNKHERLQELASSRFAQVTALSRAQKLKSVHSQITHGRTGRHMENSLQTNVPTTTTKVRADHSVASFLKSVPLFHKLDEAQILHVQRNLNRVTFKDGDIIIKQEAQHDSTFYLLESGQVRVFVQDNNIDNVNLEQNLKEKAINGGARERQLGSTTSKVGEGSVIAWGDVVNELKPGDYFGERALLADNSNGVALRTATVIAVGPVSCFTLDMDVFLSTIPRDAFGFLSDSFLSHSNEEVASLATHVSNYEVLLTMKSRARNASERKIADALLALSTAFAPELNVNDTIERIVKTLYAVFEVDRVSLFYVDWATEKLLLQVSKDGELRDVSLPLNTGLVGACALSNTVINVKDAKKDPRFFGDMDKKTNFTTRSVLCSPVHDYDGKVQAVIQLVNKRGGGFFSQDDEEMLQSVSEQMALTMAHKKKEMQTDSGDKYQPIWKTEDHFRASVKRFFGASLSQQSVSVDQVIVTMSMYHAGIELANTVLVKKKADRTSPLLIVTFNEELKLDISLFDVPRAARIIFNVAYAQVTDKGEVLNVPGEPIGWAGATLFNFDQILRTGHLRLKLFPGACTAEKAGVATMLSNNTKKDVDLLEVEFPRFEKPVIYTDYVGTTLAGAAEKAQSKMMVNMMMEKLNSFIEKDPLYKLSEDDKLLIRASRETLKDNPNALPKFLQSTNWNSRQSIQTAYRMLYRWETPSAVGALTLLDFNFPDPKVRALAVSLLESLSDADLQMYLLQLTQVLKFEPFVDSALARFLLRRALRSPKYTGQAFFWLLMAELHVPEARARYRVLLDLFLRHCGEYRTALGHQMFVLEKLNFCAMAIKKKTTKDKSETARKLLAEIVFPEKFQLPLNPDMFFKGLRVDNCRVMSSKKVPLWLSFQNAVPNSPPFTVLYKAGDDLRQDQLTLQVLKVIDRIWKNASLDLCMNVYGCVSTGFEQGMIEVVENANTIAKITAGKTSHFKKVQAIYNVYDLKILKKWLRSKGHPARVYEQNFLKSCAAYCVATYVLGIGDRHNDNIMLKEDGQLFHIDFGHFLGNFKSKMGIKRERAPFVLTPAMAGVLGGTSSALFKEFESLCCKAYNELRKFSNLLITLFSLMLSCGIPELETEDDMKWLREKLMIGASNEVAAKAFVARIHEALTTRTTQLNDAAHLLVHA